MKKRLLFLDLDGTLLNDEKEITRGNREALERTLQRGHGVIITTGRPLKSALAQAKRLGLDQPGCYTIAYNGAMVYDWSKQDKVFQRALTIPAVIRVFEKANEIGEHIQHCLIQGHHAGGLFFAVDDKGGGQKIRNVTPDLTDSFSNGILKFCFHFYPSFPTFFEKSSICTKKAVSTIVFFKKV